MKTHSILNIVGRDAMIAALVSIGFIIDENEPDCLFWGKDIDRQFRIKIPTTTGTYICPCSDTSTTLWDQIHFSEQWYLDKPASLHYRYYNDGILFYVVNNSPAPRICAGIISPVNEDDEWVVFYADRIRLLSSGYDITVPPTSSMGVKVYPLNAVSIGKFYINRFINNILYSVVTPPIPQGHMITANIGDNVYLLLNAQASIDTTTKYAFDITNEPDDE